MARTPATVRPAAPDDLAALAPLWAQLVEQAGPGGSSTSLDVGARVRERLEESRQAQEAGLRPTYRLAVAEVDGQPAGFASLSVVDRGLLSQGAVVVVDAVIVGDGMRKHGIGTALLREAAGFADEVGAADVVVNCPPSHRDVNRFFARFGFAPLVVRRSAPIGQLRRRLGVEPRLDPRDVTVDLTPVERSLRRRALLTRRTAVR